LINTGYSLFSNVLFSITRELKSATVPLNPYFSLLLIVEFFIVNEDCAYTDLSEACLFYIRFLNSYFTLSGNYKQKYDFSLKTHPYIN